MITINVIRISIVHTTYMAKETLLSVKQADRIYLMGDIEVAALRNASIDIYSGEFLIIVGPSGSGKSTLLNLIGGMDRPSHGRVVFGSQELSHASDQELTLYRRQQIGFIFQFYNLAPMLTSLENIQVATEIAEQPLDPLSALEMVGIADLADHFPSQLSGGQQQRVAIARALASNPRLLLCDEPTGALDLASSQQVLAVLQHLNRSLGKTIVLITHNQAIAGIGDRVATIRDGGIHSIVNNPSPLPAKEVSW